MLDIELLRSFVSVVDAGGFTRAGERVHRTQSAVSQQIKRLEDAVGRPLLVRDGKRATPTEEGERLLGYARRILALAQEAHVVLLDEPFTGLDKPTQESLKQLLRVLRDRGKLVLASHHDLANVSELFDRVILINGELIAEGPAAETLTPDNLTRTYGIRVFSRLAHGLAV